MPLLVRIRRDRVGDVQPHQADVLMFPGGERRHQAPLPLMLGVDVLVVSVADRRRTFEKKAWNGTREELRAAVRVLVALHFAPVVTECFCCNRATGGTFLAWGRCAACTAAGCIEQEDGFLRRACGWMGP